MVIIDNSAYSFGFNIDNGIPILSYYDSEDDKELFHLIDYMEVLAESTDIRELNREAFRLMKIVDDRNKKPEIKEESTI